MTTTGTTTSSEIAPNPKHPCLRAKLSCLLWRSRFKASFDSWLHQILVIVAVLAGFAAFAIGVRWPDQGRLAGIIGAIPSVAAILALRLHCVEAANWHRRMAQEVGGLVYRLDYEGDEVAVMSRDFRKINKELEAEWTRITSKDDLSGVRVARVLAAEHGKGRDDPRRPRATADSPSDQ
jgi:hypothetical protein